MITREKAFELLQKHTESKSLLKHAFAVEAGMIGYAKKYNEDEEIWAALGLLHDVDFEKYPEEHPRKGAEILREEGYPEDFVTAVLGHADYTNTPRETLMAKALYAVDELASFIVACVLVRPSKSFDDLAVKSVKKKLKDKAFARAVDRDCIQKGAEELNVDMTEHIQLLIDALKEREAILNEQGLSLID
ncbi:HDIG domain-containing protein [Clostridiaceae bacterium 35-E11]